MTLVAYVSARDGAPAGLLDDLKELMRSAPPPMRPGRLYLVHKIPRLPSSKLDLRALMALDEVNVQNERANVVAAAEAGPADGDCIARTVAQVWQEVLQTPVGGPEDDFFEAGGDSLKAITFMIELERALGLELSLTLINGGAEVRQTLRGPERTSHHPLRPARSPEAGRRLTAGLLHPRPRRECRGTLPDDPANDLPGSGHRYPGAWSGRPGAAARDRGGDGG